MSRAPRKRWFVGFSQHRIILPMSEKGSQARVFEDMFKCSSFNAISQSRVTSPVQPLKSAFHIGNSGRGCGNTRKTLQPIGDCVTRLKPAVHELVGLVYRNAFEQIIGYETALLVELWLGIDAQPSGRHQLVHARSCREIAVAHPSKDIRFRDRTSSRKGGIDFSRKIAHRLSPSGQRSNGPKRVVQIVTDEVGERVEYLLDVECSEIGE